MDLAVFDPIHYFLTKVKVGKSDSAAAAVLSQIESVTSCTFTAPPPPTEKYFDQKYFVEKYFYTKHFAERYFSAL